jgi:tetratricopeptide (TPR) repeat protein
VEKEKPEAPAAVPQETIPLARALEVGTELSYEVEIRFRRAPETDDGRRVRERMSQRAVVVDTDEGAGTALLGERFRTTTHRKTEGTESVHLGKTLRVYRVNRQGRSVPRRYTGTANVPGVDGLLREIGEAWLPGAEVPEGEVQVGRTWTTDEVFLPLVPALPGAKTESTLTGTCEMEGRTCARIRSRFTAGEAGGKDSFAAKVEGTREAFFDIERGVFLKVTARVVVTREFLSETEITAEANLRSVRAVPEDEWKRFAKLTRQVESLVAKVEKGQVGEALGGLHEMLAGDLTRDEKSRLLSIRDRMAEVAISGGGHRHPEAEEGLGEEERAFHRAANAAGAGQWERAATGYRTLVEKHPDHELAPAAMAALALIYEEGLQEGDAAGLRKQLVALRDKRAADAEGKPEHPVELYRLAVACADAGLVDRAIGAYRKVAESESPKLSESVRVLAPFRLAELLEGKGRRDEALEWYRVVITIKIREKYSVMLRALARKKIADLGGKP